MVPAVMVGERAGNVRVTCEGSEDMALDQAGNVPRLAPPAVADAAAKLGFTAKKERIAPDVRAEAARAATGTILFIPLRWRIVVRFAEIIASPPLFDESETAGPPHQSLTTLYFGILQQKIMGKPRK